MSAFGFWDWFMLGSALFGILAWIVAEVTA